MSASGKYFLICPRRLGGQAKPWPRPSTLSTASAGHEPRSVCLASKCSQDSWCSSQAQDRNKLVSPPPALGNLVPWSLGGLRSRFIAWTCLLLCGHGSTGDMVAGDMVPFAERRGMRVPAAFQLAAGSNEFPRLLLCVGSEFPIQRWKVHLLIRLLIVQPTSLVLKWQLTRSQS